MKIKNSEMENGCTTELHITVKGGVVGQMRLYWSARSTTYGYQVGVQMWDWRDPNNTIYDEYKTGGCGYCKESDAFDKFIRLMTDNKCHGGGGDVSYYFGRGKKYHKGGNFYSVPLSVLKKTFKRKQLAFS